MKFTLNYLIEILEIKPVDQFCGKVLELLHEARTVSRWYHGRPPGQKETARMLIALVKSRKPKTPWNFECAWRHWERDFQKIADGNKQQTTNKQKEQQ